MQKDRLVDLHLCREGQPNWTGLMEREIKVEGFLSCRLGSSKAGAGLDTEHLNIILLSLDLQGLWKLYLDLFPAINVVVFLYICVCVYEHLIIYNSPIHLYSA